MGATMQLSDRIGRRMKLQDLHVLMTVLQAGSMGKAAQRLNTTQPSVSRSIADLEHAFGVRLLDRHRQGVEPTEYGRALLDCGVAVFDDLRQGVKNIEFLADPTAGEVRIGSIPPLAASFVSAVADRLSRRHPRIVFHVVSTDTELLHRELSERNVDLLVTQRVGPLADEQLGFEKLYDDCYAVVAGEKSMGSAAQDRACRADERIVDAASSGKRAWGGLHGGISGQRTRLSSHDDVHRSRRRADQSPGDRTLSLDFLDIPVEVSHHAPTVQGLAC